MQTKGLPKPSLPRQRLPRRGAEQRLRLGGISARHGGVLAVEGGRGVNEGAPARAQRISQRHPCDAEGWRGSKRLNRVARLTEPTCRTTQGIGGHRPRHNRPAADPMQRSNGRWQMVVQSIEIGLELAQIEGYGRLGRPGRIGRVC